jgi:hypothetical protein
MHDKKKKWSIVVVVGLLFRGLRTGSRTMPSYIYTSSRSIRTHIYTTYISGYGFLL